MATDGAHAMRCGKHCMMTMNVATSANAVRDNIRFLRAGHIALARFYERTGVRRDFDVIHALTGAPALDPKGHAIGEEVPIGGWRGLIQYRPVHDDRLLLLCARTWI